MKSVIIKLTISVIVFLSFLFFWNEYREHKAMDFALFERTCKFKIAPSECNKWLEAKFLYPVDAIQVDDRDYIILTLQHGFQKKGKSDYANLVHLSVTDKTFSYRHIVSTLNVKAVNPISLTREGAFKFTIEGERNFYNIFIDSETLNASKIKIIKKSTPSYYKYIKKSILEFIKVGPTLK